MALGPAYGLPPDDHFGDEVDVAVLVAHGHRRARGVERAGRVVELAYVGAHVVARVAQAREDAPHHHRGVVEILGDDFLELLEPVLLESGRGVVGRIAQKLGPLQGRVDPHQHARFVAAVVEVLGVGHHC